MRVRSDARRVTLKYRKANGRTKSVGLRVRKGLAQRTLPVAVSRLRVRTAATKGLRTSGWQRLPITAQQVRRPVSPGATPKPVPPAHGTTATPKPPTPTPRATPTRAPFGAYVAGNRLVDGSGQDLVLHGVNRSGTEYMCVDGWGIFDGPSDQASVDAMRSWGVNAVRVPLNSACWLDIATQISNRDPEYVGAAYRSAIRSYVELLNGNGLYVVLDLQWTGCGPEPCLANWLKPMPDRPYATQFWSSVAGQFKDDPGVLFDLFNEPRDVDWPCWQSGGCAAPSDDPNATYTLEGMQQLVSAVRTAGAVTQPILLGGLHYANDMTGWLAHLPQDPSSSLVASVHLYNFSWPCPLADGPLAEDALSCMSPGGENSLAAIAATHPLVFGELGQDGCGRDFVDPVLAWIGQRRYSVLGWAWNVADCSAFPALISDYSGTPTSLGAAFRQFYQEGTTQTVASTSGTR